MTCDTCHNELRSYAEGVLMNKRFDALPMLDKADFFRHRFEREKREIERLRSVLYKPSFQS